MSRFHHQSHMKGGFDVDESKLDDNAVYWKRYARGAKSKLYDLLDEKMVVGLIDKIWQPENTWKFICLETERILQEQEKIKNEKQSIRE